MMLQDDQKPSTLKSIDIVGQPQDERLKVLRQQRAARGTIRELALCR